MAVWLSPTVSLRFADVPLGKNVPVVAVGRVREMFGPTYLTLMNGCCTRYSGLSKLA